MKEIQRKDYLQRLNELKDRHFIKVLTGIRRSGKSTILKQFIHQLKTKYVIDSNQIINYDFNNVNLKKYTYKKLYDEIINKSSKNTTNYVFLDEIQEVKNFEKCVIALFENKQIKFDIYITGSNSHMFSSKLATLFTGRNAPIYVYPITFKSFFKELNKSTDRSKSFEKYLKYGGLGIVIPNYDNEKMLQQTLN
jgi:predicted AAA+ superfamily ATPase